MKDKLNLFLVTIRKMKVFADRREKEGCNKGYENLWGY